MTLHFLMRYNEGILSFSDRKNSYDRHSEIFCKLFKIPCCEVYVLSSGHSPTIEELNTVLSQNNSINNATSAVEVIKNFINQKVSDPAYMSIFNGGTPFEMAFFVIAKNDNNTEIHRMIHSIPSIVNLGNRISHYIGSGGEYINLQIQKLRLTCSALTLEEALTLGVSLMDFIADYDGSKVGKSIAMGCDVLIAPNSEQIYTKTIEGQNNYSKNLFQVCSELNGEGKLNYG